MSQNHRIDILPLHTKLHLKEAPLSRLNNVYFTMIGHLFRKQKSVSNIQSFVSDGQNFIYDSLETPNSFRLLKFESFDPGSGLLRFSIVTYPLFHNTRPPYYALSYTWGETERDKQILLNGRTLNITRSLYEAIMQLNQLNLGSDNQSSALVEHWWIDMICINQGSNAERGQQVELMRDIFQQASLTVAWIGPARDGSDEVIDQLPFPKETRTNLGGSQELFLNRPYWYRAWIIQEICVSKEVLLVCGRKTVKWDVFADYFWNRNVLQELVHTALPRYNGNGVKWMDGHLTNLTWTAPGMLIDLRRRFQQDPDKLHLEEVLCYSLDANCSKPPDRVYSVLGLVKKGRGLQIAVDYDKSACVIYQEALKIVVKENADHWMDFYVFGSKSEAKCSRGCDGGQDCHGRQVCQQFCNTQLKKMRAKNALKFGAKKLHSDIKKMLE